MNNAITLSTEHFKKISKRLLPLVCKADAKDINLSFIQNALAKALGHRNFASFQGANETSSSAAIAEHNTDLTPLAVLWPYKPLDSEVLFRFFRFAPDTLARILRALWLALAKREPKAFSPLAESVFHIFLESQAKRFKDIFPANLLNKPYKLDFYEKRPKFSFFLNNALNEHNFCPQLLSAFESGTLELLKRLAHWLICYSIIWSNEWDESRVERRKRDMPYLQDPSFEFIFENFCTDAGSEVTLNHLLKHLAYGVHKNLPFTPEQLLLADFIVSLPLPPKPMI